MPVIHQTASEVNNICSANGLLWSNGGTILTGENHVPLPLCIPQINLNLTKYSVRTAQ
jgi:hypothetical protein